FFFQRFVLSHNHCKHQNQVLLLSSIPYFLLFEEPISDFSYILCYGNYINIFYFLVILYNTSKVYYKNYFYIYHLKLGLGKKTFIKTYIYYFFYQFYCVIKILITYIFLNLFKITIKVIMRG